MKLLLHILILFAVSTVILPQEAQACGETTEHSCHTESESDQEKPCGESSCDCICCAHVSLILIKKEFPAVEALDHTHTEVFFYQNYLDLLFKSAIWQPPRLR